MDWKHRIRKGQQFRDSAYHYTNGGMWSFNDGENKMQALCPDYRLALLYMLSQERKRFHAAKPKQQKNSIGCFCRNDN